MVSFLLTASGPPSAGSASASVSPSVVSALGVDAAVDHCFFFHRPSCSPNSCCVLPSVNFRTAVAIAAACGAVSAESAFAVGSNPRKAGSFFSRGAAALAMLMNRYAVLWLSPVSFFRMDSKSGVDFPFWEVLPSC